MTELPDDPNYLETLAGQLHDGLERLEAENAELRRRSGSDSSARKTATGDRGLLGAAIDIATRYRKSRTGSIAIAIAIANRDIDSEPAPYGNGRVVRHPTENNSPKLRSLDHVKPLFSFARTQAHRSLCNCYCNAEAGR
ncbi:MAG: hypothetical protein BECKG1743D_GA0114223_102714 [Candidatus Kentron sp. G]|nr:MAG: hypothetical protein BECKG1743E_GA0114224_102413 [Candidatus Kentron sp. G]VFN01340.1 MAG: hypothetical protein BECKG1743D_GA0114223_102714 [Candidatus Kentron sp. G]